MKKTQATLVKTRLQLTDAQPARHKQAEQLGVEHAARQDGRHQGRRVRAEGAGLRAEDHRSERRAGEVGGEG